MQRLLQTVGAPSYPACPRTRGSGAAASLGEREGTLPSGRVALTPETTFPGCRSGALRRAAGLARRPWHWPIAAFADCWSTGSTWLAWRYSAAKLEIVKIAGNCLANGNFCHRFSQTLARDAAIFVLGPVAINFCRSRTDMSRHGSRMSKSPAPATTHTRTAVAAPRP
jgi:hypothetical protein